jgi:hypothetical protein
MPTCTEIQCFCGKCDSSLDGGFDILIQYTHFEHDFSNPCNENCTDRECIWDHSTTLSCNNCGQFGEIVTSHCPNFDITVKQMSKIQQGKLDFFKGKWWIPNE